MSTFVVTFRPECHRPPERITGDRADVEAERWVVVRGTAYVMNQPREVIVRRLSAADVLTVEREPG